MTRGGTSKGRASFTRTWSDASWFVPGAYDQKRHVAPTGTPGAVNRPSSSVKKPLAGASCSIPADGGQADLHDRKDIERRPRLAVLVDDPSACGRRRPGDDGDFRIVVAVDHRVAGEVGLAGLRA